MDSNQKSKWWSKFLLWVIATALGVVIGSLIFKSVTKKEDEIGILYHHQMELEYSRTKANIVDKVDSVIHFYAPTSDLHGIVLVDLCEEYNIDVRFALAQGLLESHYGTKGLACRTNSVFNIYAYDSTSYEDLSSKGKFNHPDKSVKPYLELITKNYLGDRKTEFDLMQNYVTIKDNKRYASDKNYEVRLRQKYEEINDSVLDSLINDLRYIKLKLNR